MDLICARRSIRKFEDTPVKRDILEEVIKAGMNAPSAMNQQPWQFVIMEDRSCHQRILEVHPNAVPLTAAPVGLLVCGDLSRETAKGYWSIDCAAATENMLLKITELGLGGCWLGIYPRQQRVDALRDIIGAPEHIVPFALIAMGYPDESKGPKDIFDPERVHADRWGQK